MFEGFMLAFMWVTVPMGIAGIAEAILGAFLFWSCQQGFKIYGELHHIQGAISEHEKIIAQKDARMAELLVEDSKDFN